MNLFEKIVSLEKFRTESERLISKLTLSDLSNIANLDTPISWNYLVSCASVLSLSTDDEHREKALQICSAAIKISDSGSAKSAVAIILERLGCKPTIQLALNKKRLSKELLENLPVSAYWSAPLRIG